MSDFHPTPGYVHPPDEDAWKAQVAQTMSAIEERQKAPKAIQTPAQQRIAQIPNEIRVLETAIECLKRERELLATKDGAELWNLRNPQKQGG